MECESLGFEKGVKQKLHLYIMWPSYNKTKNKQKLKALSFNKYQPFKKYPYTLSASRDHDI